MSQKYIEDELRVLREEIKEMENVTLVAIEDLENKLGSLGELEKIEDDWSPRLDVLEIYTMEKMPSLSESIRQISKFEL